VVEGLDLVCLRPNTVSPAERLKRGWHVIRQAFTPASGLEGITIDELGTFPCHTSLRTRLSDVAAYFVYNSSPEQLQPRTVTKP